jgi:hypothetical protein
MTGNGSKSYVMSNLSHGLQALCPNALVYFPAIQRSLQKRTNEYPLRTQGSVAKCTMQFAQLLLERDLLGMADIELVLLHYHMFLLGIRSSHHYHCYIAMMDDGAGLKANIPRPQGKQSARPCDEAYVPIVQFPHVELPVSFCA